MLTQTKPPAELSADEIELRKQTRAGLRVEAVQDNPQYRFISDNARAAARKYGVKSVSILAVKA